MRKVWIEVALNGAWSRRLQPGIPIRSETIVAEVSRARERAPPSSTHMPTDRRWKADLLTGRSTPHHRGHSCRGGCPGLSVLSATMPMPRCASPISRRWPARPARLRRDRSGQRSTSPRSQTKATARPAGTLTSIPKPMFGMRSTSPARHGLHPAFAIYEPGFTRAGAALARCRRRQDAGLSLHVL